MIGVLKERLGSFVEDQRNKIVNRRRAILGSVLVHNVRRGLGVSLVDHPYRWNQHPDPDFLAWGEFVERIHNDFQSKLGSDPDLRKSVRKLNIWTSVSAIVGLFEKWRDELNSLTPVEFSQKVVTENEFMRKLLTKLRYAPEGRSYLVTLRRK